jgi:hypothetical protein
VILLRGTGLLLAAFGIAGAPPPYSQGRVIDAITGLPISGLKFRKAIVAT